MKEFKVLAALVADKNGNRHIGRLRPMELKAYNELVEIAKKFRSEDITKDQATAFKLKLKAKYELCCKHFELMADLADFIVEGTWNATDTEEFKQDMTCGFFAIAEKIKEYELPMYNNLAVNAVEYLQDRIKDGDK